MTQPFYRKHDKDFDRFFTLSPDMLCMASFDGYFKRLNPAFETTLGYTVEELLAQPFLNFVHVEDKAAMSAEITKLSTGIPTIDFENRYRCKDGSYKWLAWTVAPYIEEELLYAIAHDITERKRTEEALRLSEARFRTLAEKTDVVLSIHQGMQLCYLNPAAELVTGYQRGELLTHPSLYQLLKVVKGKHVHNESSYLQHQEIKLITKNGEECWVDCSFGTLEFDGKPAKLITAVDITKRKKAEEEIRQALEKEKEIGILRSRFVSMVSHEFRTPLNLISFSTSLLRRYNQKWTDKKKLQYLDRIQAVVEQLTQLLDEVLMLGKAEAEKLEFEPKMMNLNQFCRDLVSEIQLNNHQHSFIITSLGSCEFIQADEKLLRPILTNLLSNATKYSTSGSVIRVQLVRQVRNVILQITDQGIGIPVADQQRLFEPFYRGKNVGDIPGTGLGLAVVKKLLDACNGQILVESAIGVGTTFTITLPTNQQQESVK